MVVQGVTRPLLSRRTEIADPGEEQWFDEQMRRNVLRAQREALLDAPESGELDDDGLRTVRDGLDIELAETRIERFAREARSEPT